MYLQLCLLRGSTVSGRVLGLVHANVLQVDPGSYSFVEYLRLTKGIIYTVVTMNRLALMTKLIGFYD